jgi:hypothetical protein
MIRFKGQRAYRRYARFFTTIAAALSLTGCVAVDRKIDPVIVYTPPAERINRLPSAFPLFSNDETSQEWCREAIIGNAFAAELDLYRAITCYKRARILLPQSAVERRLQLDYNIIFAYYLGRQYQEAINTFEESALMEANPRFPAFGNLLVILYECYRERDQIDKADTLFNLIEKCSPETAEDLTFFFDLKEGNIEEVENAIAQNPAREEFEAYLAPYHQLAKSPIKARRLNALLPGAGYHYVGQTKSAVTSFIINSLFIAASYQFFQRGYIAAGLITTSLEAGWYLGGINGAGIAAKEFNTRLYENSARGLLIKNRLFPILTFETAF